MAVGDSRILQIVLKAVDDASGTLAKVGEEVTGLDAKSKTAAASFAKAGDQLSSVGQAMLPVSLAAAGALGLSAKAAMDFQQQMELLHTQAGLSQQSVDGLKSSVLALAPTVGQGPTQLAEAFYHIASAGNGIWSTAQMLDMLKIAAEGAAVGQANLDDTTYSLTSALASGVKGAKDAAEMMSVLNAIVGAGDMRFQDLNGAIATGFLGTAAAFGISLQSVGTALATLTDNGEQADAAATRLRMTWALMAAPSQMAAKQLEALGLTAEGAKSATESMNKVFAASGLTTTKLADDLRQPNGITVAMRDLQTHLEKAGLSASETDAMLAKAFGGGRTDAAILTMLQNLDRMDTKFKLINQSTGNFANDWASQQDTAAQHVKDFMAQVDVLGVKLGNAFLPTLTKVADQLGRAADWFGKLNPQTQQWVVIGLAAAAALAPLLIGLGGLVTAIGALLSPVGLILGAFALLAAAWGLFAWRAGEFAQQVKDHWGQITQVVQAGVELLKRGGQDVAGVFQMFFDLVSGGDPTLRGYGDDLVGVAKAFAGLRDHVLDAIDGFKRFYDQSTRTLQQWKTDGERIVNEWGRKTNDALKPWQHDFVGTLTDTLNQFNKFAYGYLESVKNEIVNGLKQHWAEMETYLSQLPGMWGKWFDATKKQIEDKLSSWNNAIGTYMTQTLPHNFTSWLGGVGNTIGTWFTATATTLPQDLEKWGTAIGLWFGKLPGRFESWLDSVGTAISDWWTGMGKTEKQVKAQGKAVSDTVDNLNKGFQKNWPTIARNLADAMALAMLAVPLLIVAGQLDLAYRLITGIGNGIIQYGPIITAAVANAVGQAFTWLRNEVSAWPGRVGSFLSSLPATIGNIFTSAKNWALGEMNNLWNGLTAIWNKISGIFNNISNAVGKGFSAGESVGKALHLPGFASGTSFAPGGWALVGERGPELVNLPRGSQVIPHNQVGAAGASVNITGPITIQSPLDLDTLGHNILWSLKTSGRL